MQEIIVDEFIEKQEILKRYRALLRACRATLHKGDRTLIRHAFELAVEAHKDMRRKSGEPYIFHLLAVAQIAAEEIGLGTTSIVCALLHDVVEDTSVTLDEIERQFGKKTATIIDGLTKISGVFDQTSSIQAENFRKMLLTLADDVRVILIKLADRLHNMRTLDSMPRDKQLKISSETTYLYAPLAHRLGLYAIKSELEDLAMKFTERAAYKSIARKLQETKAERNRFISEFIDPVIKALEELDLKATVVGRPKSIFSIWTKMKKKGVPFEEVYDLFAIRIILKCTPEEEKADCWKAYSIVTDYYHPNPDRLRDWVSSPKGNGYESLHTTVMGPKGKWVEVQIRSERMNEIAEKGFAAHWKYKESSVDSGLDNWIKKVRDLLQNADSNALDFLDDFKMNLFSDEIFIFTPKGALIKLPNNATTLDFAFEIHSDIGSTCIGAKVNHKLVPLSHRLHNGDQVEIITSSKQTPREDWLNFVVTAKAKSKIKAALKETKRKVAEDGKALLERKMKSLKIPYNSANLHKLTHFFKLQSTQELFYQVAEETIELKQLKQYLAAVKTLDTKPHEKAQAFNTDYFTKHPKTENDLLIGDDMQKLDYTLAACCNPIPGDDVFGFVTVADGIKIHRTNCPNAERLLSSYGYRIIKARWRNQQEIVFLTGIRLKGIDDVGVVNNITKVISSDFKINIRSISVESNEGIFEGEVMVYVNNTDHLDELIKKLGMINGILTVARFDALQNN